MLVLIATSCAKPCRTSATDSLLSVLVMLAFGAAALAFVLLMAKAVAIMIRARTGRDVWPSARRWARAYGFGVVGLGVTAVWRWIHRARGRPAPRRPDPDS